MAWVEDAPGGFGESLTVEHPGCENPRKAPATAFLASAIV